VVLDAAPTADVTIALSSSNTAEGSLLLASLTFTTADWNIAQSVTVTGVDDSVDDDDIAYSILTAAAVSTDAAYNGLDASDVAATNADNDIAGITIAPVSGLVTSEAGGIATFTVALDTLPTADVTFAITSLDTTEGNVSTALLTFTSLNGMTPQTVTITGADDAIPDGSIAYTVDVAAASSTDLKYTGLDPSNVSVVNTDNDTPGITVSPISGLITNESSGIPATFTVVLNTIPSANVTIAVSSSNPAEGTVSTALLTFLPGNALTPQIVSVTGVDDTFPTADGNKLYTVVLAAASSADGGYNLLDPSDVSVTNVDDDVAGVTVTLTTVPQTTEGGGTATFDVSLDTVPSAIVTIAVTVSDTTEGSSSTALLTFPADFNALTPQTVTITGLNDALQDGDITYTVILGTCSSADASYSVIDPVDVTLTNKDNDSPGVTVTPPTGLITSESGNADTFSVVLNSIPSADVTIAVTSSNLLEGTVDTALLTFTPGNALTPQLVTVTGVDDAILDGNIAYSILLGATSSTDGTYNGLVPGNVGAINTDDEAAPPGSAGWTKDAANPVLLPGTGGAFDNSKVTEPFVIQNSPTSFTMWYEGINSNGQKRDRIGRALSSDAVAWTKTPSTAILSPSGVNGTFDKTGVQQPSVHFDGATYRLWFGGRNANKNKIGLATSTDGITWVKSPSNPVLTISVGQWDSLNVFSPHVIFDGAQYVMWYSGTNASGLTRIGRATSPDGVVWTKTVGNPVLDVTAATFDAAGVRTPCVIKDGTTYRMWYAGLDLALGGKYRIGYADSADGITWTKFSGNPVLTPGAAGEFDASGVTAPCVVKDGTTFRMWYSGQDALGITRIGYAEN
jgi:predicted GH43/DUF377 family glycosyl hydrolase